MEHYRLSWLIIVVTFCCSCSSFSPLGQTSSSTLFAKIGGKVVLENVVDNLVNNIGQDDVIFHFFADSNVTRFKEKLYLHLCEVADGPCKYDGDSMIDIHTGMKIQEGDFNHLVELLIKAMDSAGVSYPLQNTLLYRLAPMRADIIKI